MGYGFVRYETPEAAQKAMRQLQQYKVNEHQLELKISEREVKFLQVRCGAAKEKKANCQETDDLEDPGAKHPLPGHGQRTARTLLYVWRTEDRQPAKERDRWSSPWFWLH